MANNATITLTVKLAWWIYPYLGTLAWLCRVTGREPDSAKVEGMVARAVKVKAS